MPWIAPTLSTETDHPEAIGSADGLNIVTAAGDGDPGAGLHWTAVGEVVALIALLIAAAATAALVPRIGAQALLSPNIVSLLLVANLLPAMALMVFAGRRIARYRVRQRGGGDARLHMRLVAIFSVTAALPTIVVAIYSSFLFQSGMEFWFSERSRGMFENAVSVAQNFFASEKRDVGANTQAMATDLRVQMARTSIDSPAFYDFYVQQVVVRELSESAILEVGEDGVVRSLALIDPDNRAADTRLPVATIAALDSGVAVVESENRDSVDAVVRLLPDRPVYLYAGRGSRLLGLESIRRARSVFSDYNALFANSRALQYRFMLALYLGSLILVGLVIFVAIVAADRIVRPLDQLVDAAGAVSSGNLNIRVPAPKGRPDEIALLAQAFNHMTERLSHQTRDLVDARDQIEERRAFIEAVLAAVATGVFSLDREGRVRFANRAAASITGHGSDDLVGLSLSEAAPELGDWIATGGSDPIITIDVDGDERTLAVRLVGEADAKVLTFDDISQQLLDERRAAWSDVARRIAHEIKNPLTPIQLAAERLQRRFGAKIGDDDETFRKLTSTIVRQVGDLRRIVDEFSSFARMPQPSFRLDNISDALRQSVFLQEVANPDIRFDVDLGSDTPPMLSDRRLLGQAFTNILKNAVEAIVARDVSEGAVKVTMQVSDEAVTILFADNGVGLPDVRDRITDPYVTAREGGTGLGLAVVKKIVEDHAGEITFADRPGGGTIVTVVLRPALIARRQGKLLLEGADDGARHSGH